MSDHLQDTKAEEAQRVTRPCARFLKEGRELALFLARTLDLANAMDKMMLVLGKVLPSIGEAIRKAVSDPEQMAGLGEEEAILASQIAEVKDLWEQLERIEGSRPFMANILTTHRQLLLELLLCRAVDNFLTYTSEILALIYRSRPETLRSNETERLDVILQYNSMDELVAALAEKRVNELSYLGLERLSNHLYKRLGFSLFELTDALTRAVRIVELRNLITHNRGVLNDRFLSRVSNFPARVGESVILEMRTVLDDINFLSRSVKDMDTRAAAKFSLATPAERDTLW